MGDDFKNVGADLCVCPLNVNENKMINMQIEGRHTGLPLRVVIV